MPPASELLSYARKHLPALIVLLVVVVLTFAYVLGVRPGPGLTFVRSGSLTLAGLPAGAVVYADRAPRATSAGGDTVIRLVPGDHSIIVDMPGGYPWNDIVSITAGHDTRSAPINVPKTIEKKSLSSKDRALLPILRTENPVPSKDSPLPLLGGCALVSVADHRVLATGTTTPTCAPPSYLCAEEVCDTNVVFSSDAPIRGVLPLPGHPDALLISYGSTVAVVELNPLSPQFYAPVFQGAPAAILPWEGNSFVIANSKEAFTVTLP